MTGFSTVARNALPVAEIARTRRINAAQVYLAKNRVGAVLKRVVGQLELKMERSHGARPES